jgi:hypothetical protein
LCEIRRQCLAKTVRQPAMESQVDVSTPNSELPTAPVGDRGTRADMPFRWPHTGRVKHTYYVARERRRPIFIIICRFIKPYRV